MQNSAYIPAIDGLRAMAVLSVLAFHWNVPGFTQGFVGVDAFFVVSGFVIMRSSLTIATKDEFRIAQFYKRRVKRLLPAALAMITTTCIIQAITDSYGSAMHSPFALAAVASLSNILFWRHSTGYFSSSAEENPFLHTWSLATEEQFYLAFPIAFALLNPSKQGARSRLRLACWVTIAMSAALWSTPIFIGRGHSFGFFMLPARAWQITLGALLAIPAPDGRLPRQSRLVFRGLASFAMAALALSAPLWVPDVGPHNLPRYSSQFMATMATLVALHICQAAPHAQILSHSGLRAIGKLSYSLYLWHWPIGLFIDRSLQDPSPTLKLLLSVAAAAMSYNIVEQPLRRGPYPIWRPLAAAAAVALGLAVAVTHRSDALQHAAHTDSSPKWEHFTYSVNPTETEGGLGKIAASSQLTPRPASIESAWRTGGIQLGRVGPADIAVWGDSHGVMLGPAIAQIAREQELSVHMLTAGGGVSPWLQQSLTEATEVAELPSLDEVTPFSPEAFGLARAIHTLTNRPKQVIIARRWDYETDQSRGSRIRTIDWLNSLGIKVTLVTGAPFVRAATNYPVGAIMKRWPQRRGAMGGLLALPRLGTVKVESLFPARILQDNPLCSVANISRHLGEGGLIKLNEGGEVLLVDDDHLSTAGALRCAPTLRRFMGPKSRE